MQVTIKKIVLENYKCFHDGKSLSADFYHRTRISGENRKGKSTVQDAFYDIMTGKMSDGTQTDNIRPHDENGVDIDKIDIIRELHLEIDGKPTVIRKVTKQKWRKPHNKTEEVFDGNETKYEVDGFPMSQKQMAEFFERIAKADTLLMCTNAQAFLKTLQKSMPDARKLLETLVGFDANQFARDNGYTEAEKLMNGHSAEEVLKKLNKQRLEEQNKCKAQNEVIKAKKAEFVDKAKHPIEIAELELSKGEWREKLAEIGRQEEQLNEAVKTYDSLTAEIRRLKIERDSISQKANEGLEKKRKEIRSEVNHVEAQKMNIENKIILIKQDISNAERIQQANEELKGRCLEDWTKANDKLFETENRIFDENSLICSMCGQEYPEERKEQIRADFDKHKAEEKERFKKKMGDANARGLEVVETVKKCKKEIEQFKAELKQLEDEKIVICESIAGLNSCLLEVPQSADLSENDEYQLICGQIADKEKELSSLNNGADKRAELRNKRNECMDAIANIDGEIKYISEFEIAKENSITDYTAKLREMAQIQADLERQYELIKEFSRRKNEALASQINPHFRHFQFNFVKYTIEGNPYEVCEIVCNGTSYFNGLNGGDKRLCEIDLCRGLQELNNIVLPIWVDEANTIDDWRIPQDLEQQLILMERQNGELKVEEMEVI